MAMIAYDDKDLDDDALWAVIDSAAAAASYSTTITTATTATATATTTAKFRKPQTLKPPNSLSSPHVYLPPSPSPPSSHLKSPSPRVCNNNWDDYQNVPPKKMAKTETEMSRNNNSPDLRMVKRSGGGGRSTPVFSSTDSVKELSPFSENHNNSPQFEYKQEEEKFRHCLSGRFPTVSLFKDYQDAAMELLEKSDYTMISGSPFIKKSGWRKIAFYFNVSFEIKDKDIEFDENRNVQRAEFVVRAYMQGGRFSDGWGSCERREKRFLKPNNDIPSTAETRAKNKACQDLLGIGAYRPRVSNVHSPR